MADHRPLILIPSFNTGPILRATVESAIGHGARVWVVIDGSTDGSEKLLDDLVTAENPEVHRIILPVNRGKGGAVRHALGLAIEDGFTHILTMDADGQHPADRIAAYLELSRRHPEAAVFGRPVFDASAPALRVNGRKVSNFWANLETLGWGIDDSLFGMRLYPARALCEVMDSTRFARRFDFDPEVAVRLCWRGVPIINLPTPVRYLTPEEGGVSQFRYLRDNTLLTWMHLRLLLGFLVRAPWLLARGGNPLESQNPPHA
ncbi:MAG: glycosyltransferase family 2 protein [Akkermansiaceae bacterium]|nr:glycosyltransferase family 2 protein [Akkermansiaceae bacterium]